MTDKMYADDMSIYTDIVMVPMADGTHPVACKANGPLAALPVREGKHVIVTVKTGGRVVAINSNSVTVAMFHVEQLLKLADWSLDVEEIIARDPTFPARMLAYANKWKLVELRATEEDGSKKIYARAR